MGAAGLVQRDALIAGSLGRAALASLARQIAVASGWPQSCRARHMRQTAQPQ